MYSNEQGQENKISNEMKAIIVGLWRQGNKFEVIASVMGLNVLDVQLVIEKYFSNHV